MPILPKAPNAIKKGFLKATCYHLNRFFQSGVNFLHMLNLTIALVKKN
jgi:hypothetical protein